MVGNRLLLLDQYWKYTARKTAGNILHPRVLCEVDRIVSGSP
jgi:hypothetical protein